MANTVHLVQLSTALRDRPYDETDADCHMSFSEVPNVNSFRVVAVSIPISLYTFSDTNNTFPWQYSISSVYNLDDFLTLRAARWSTFGTNSRVLTYRETATGGGVRLEKTVTINDIFYTNIADILQQINVPPAEAPAGFIRWNSTTNKLYLDVPAVGDAVRVELICDCLDVLGVSPRLSTLSIYDGPVIPEVLAQGTVNLQPRVSAVGVPVTWRPDSIEAGFYPPVEVISILQGLFISAGYNLADANTKGLQWVEGVGPMFAKNTNLTWQVVGISPNFARITSMQDNGTLPYALRNVTDPDSSTAVTTGPIDVTKTQLSWGPDQVVTFDTDALYTEGEILTALNASFAPVGAVWSADHNRLKVTNGENAKIRFGSNVVLGINVPGQQEVAKSAVWQSKTVYDLSGGNDVFYLGCPDLYQHGRTSQGFGPNATRRRDIVATIANTSSASFGTYVHFYDQSGLFIPLGSARSISTLRTILYNQRFEPIPTTNGIPVHVSIELI